MQRYLSSIPINFYTTLLTLLILALSCKNPIQESNPQPNIIYIMSDDHAYQAIGAYQSRLASLNPTPVIDKLAAEGILFNNVFCTNSICTPSRATIMTGQYSQTNGVLDLDGRLPPERQFLPQEMKKLGYETAMIGKWHLKDAPESFDYYNVLPVQGNYFDPIFITREPGDTVQLINFHGGVSREVNVTKHHGHSTDVITDISLEWLQKKRDPDKPFFLMHHYKAPHDDFEYAPRYESYLANTFIPEPASLYHQPDFGSVAIHGQNGELTHRIGTSVSDRHDIRNYTTQYGIETVPRDSATSQAYQKYLKRYLRCVKGIDDNLKRLFDYLKKNDLWENTVIIYTGDQGMMLGEHDFMDKRWMYDESMRMPFIVSYPHWIKTGRSTDLLINNTDFAPTIIELAGGTVPQYMQGYSFTNLLAGEVQEPLRESTYYRYWMHLVHHDVPACFGIRSTDYKLIYYYSEHYNQDKYGEPTMTWMDTSFNIESTPKAWELYDLKKDPLEVKNVYQDPQYTEVIAQLKEALKNARNEHNETDKDYPHLEEAISKYWDQ